MGIETATMGADGVVTSTPSPQTFLHTNNGQYHAVDHTADSIPSSHAGVQAQKLGGIGSLGKAAAKSSKTGKAQMVASRDHGHLTAHGASSGPKQDIFGKVGKWARGGYAEKPKAKPKGKPGTKGFMDRMTNLFKENSEGLSAAQLLRVHIELQKLEEKSKTVV